MANSSRLGRVVSLSTVHHGHDNRVFNKEAKALVAAGHDYHLVISADRDGIDQGVPVVALHREEGRVRRLVVSQREAWRHLQASSPKCCIFTTRSSFRWHWCGVGATAAR
ncbi:glycosyl transferase [Cutibacterium acnes JCM 18909]|nr:glycosyl transferase [Cutibacterium acnes JCM 18909]